MADSIGRAIRDLCFNYCSGRVNDESFKSSLRTILDEHESNNYFVHQAIGLALTRRLEGENEMSERVWALTDEVEPRIRNARDNWRSSIKEKLGI